MTIHEFQLKHLQDCISIVSQNYGPRYKREIVEDLYAAFSPTQVYRPVYFVAIEDDKIVGFIGYNQSWMDFHAYEIFWVQVHPDFQKQGFGKSLMCKVLVEIQAIEKAELVLLTCMEHLRPFYTALGFRVLDLGGRRGEKFLLGLTLK